MGNTAQQPERPDPGKTIEFIGEDGMYHIPPDDIFYMTIQPDRQNTPPVSKDRSSRATGFAMDYCLLTVVYAPTPPIVPILTPNDVIYRY